MCCAKGGWAHYNPKSTNCKENPRKSPGSFLFWEGDMGSSLVAVYDHVTPRHQISRFLTIRHICVSCFIVMNRVPFLTDTPCISHEKIQFTVVIVLPDSPGARADGATTARANHAASGAHRPTARAKEAGVGPGENTRKRAQDHAGRSQGAF